MKEIDLVYRGPRFPGITITPQKYRQDFFDQELDLESEEFFELRQLQGILPHRINQASVKEKLEIKQFFEAHQDTFYFLEDGPIVIGSILFIDNFIQCLTVAGPYQNRGLGKQLTQFAINRIYDRGFTEVILRVLEGNKKALELYLGLGFKVC